MGDVTASEVCVALKASPPVIANIHSLWPPVVDALIAGGMGSRLNQIGVAATIGVENPSFKPVAENLNYSASALVETWPKRFPSLDFAQQYHRQPEQIADYVYANRMGNGPPDSGDGWRYRGRGPIQITGRDTYAACGTALGLDLLAQPDLLLTIEAGAKSVAWFWDWKGCAGPCDLGDWERVRRLVNGGLTHYADFLAIVRRCGIAA